MKVGVIGASGYSGEVLVKLLLAHPRVTLAAVTSRSQAGKPLASVIPSLRGADRGLKFTDSDPAALAASDIDLFFLALPHGAAATYAKVLVPAGKRVIDLSADFRIADLATYEKYYGKHHAPELLSSARFVLPELTPPAWKTEAKLIAAPGCYPTSILLPLVPVLKAGLVTREHIVANSFSGVSGAGRKVDEMYLYVERAESAKAYGLTKHRHLAEIEEQLSGAAGAKIRVTEPGNAAKLLWFEQVMILDSQSAHSYYALAPTERHFGLGGRGAVDVSVEFYPSGKRVERKSVAANSTVTLAEEK